MTIKRFCDVCEEEIQGASVTSDRLKDSTRLRNKLVEVEIICGVSNGPTVTMNAGDLCRPCLLHAIDRLFDTRPKTASA